MNCRQQDGDKTWEKLKEQIARLSQMYNFPREPMAIRELVIALQTATSIEQAEHVVSEILATAAADTRCPMGSQIRAACKALQLDPQPDPLCQTCGGDGWRTIVRGGLSGSDRCRCWAPRPAPTMDYVPLHGPLRDIEDAAKKLTLPKLADEDRIETRKLAARTHIDIGESA